MVSTKLSAIVLTFLAISTAQAGWIEEKGEKTIIHVKVFFVPDPSDTRPYWRAEYAGVERFRQRFPEIFAQRYRDTYKANPDKYGRYPWDHVEIQLHRATGIEVEGVETDLMQIAGDMAPDHCTGQKVRIADKVDKYDVLAPSTHSRVA